MNDREWALVNLLTQRIGETHKTRTEMVTQFKELAEAQAIIVSDSPVPALCIFCHRIVMKSSDAVSSSTFGTTHLTCVLEFLGKEEVRAHLELVC